MQVCNNVDVDDDDDDNDSDNDNGIRRDVRERERALRVMVKQFAFVMQYVLCMVEKCVTDGANKVSRRDRPTL